MITKPFLMIETKKNQRSENARRVSHRSYNVMTILLTFTRITLGQSIEDDTNSIQSNKSRKAKCGIQFRVR